MSLLSSWWLCALTTICRFAFEYWPKTYAECILNSFEVRVILSSSFKDVLVFPAHIFCRQLTYNKWLFYPLFAQSPTISNTQNLFQPVTRLFLTISLLNLGQIALHKENCRPHKLLWAWYTHPPFLPAEPMCRELCSYAITLRLSAHPDWPKNQEQKMNIVTSSLWSFQD